MSAATAMPARRRRTFVWFAIAAGLLLLAGANAHLVYVAARSQPDCVPHVRADGGRAAYQFAAAKSSCTVR
jgi:hypothetical protein